MAAKRKAFGRKASLADVARVAKVSPSTASRALNGHGEVSAKTRQAVVEASLKLAYRPSPIARSLRMQTSSIVGFVVPDIASLFYAGVLKAAQSTLKDAGFRVMVMESEHDLAAETDALRVLLEHYADGILLATKALTPEQCSIIGDGKRPPCVFFDTIVEGIGAGGVTLENEAGIELIVDHLVGVGHRAIAILVGAQTESTAIGRLRGFNEAMARRGLNPSEKFVRICHWTRESGRAAALDLLQSRPRRPTAIIATSDDLAVGALLASRELGLRIPDHLSLVAFDDPYFGELLETPLTALTYDPAAIGKSAASILVQRIHKKRVGQPLQRIPVTLVERASVAPPLGKRRPSHGTTH